MSRYDTSKMSDYEILQGIDEKLVDAKEDVKKSIVKYNRLLRQRNDIADKCQQLGIEKCASDHHCRVKLGFCLPSAAEDNVVWDEEDNLRRLGYDPYKVTLYRWRK